MARSHRGITPCFAMPSPPHCWRSCCPVRRAFAVSSKDKMATCKFGADDQQLQGQGAQAFMKKCMSNKDDPRGGPRRRRAPCRRRSTDGLRDPQPGSHSSPASKRRFSDKRKSSMRMVAYLLAIICVIAAVMYFVMPAGQLPTFMPGYEVGLGAYPYEACHHRAGGGRCSVPDRLVFRAPAIPTPPPLAGSASARSNAPMNLPPLRTLFFDDL